MAGTPTLRQLKMLADMPYTYGLAPWEVYEIRRRMAIGETAEQIVAALGWRSKTGG